MTVSTKLWIGIATVTGIIVLSFLLPHRDERESRKIIGKLVLDEAVGKAKRRVKLTPEQERNFAGRFWARLTKLFGA